MYRVRIWVRPVNGIDQEFIHEYKTENEAYDILNKYYHKGLRLKKDIRIYESILKYVGLTGSVTLAHLYFCK